MRKKDTRRDLILAAEKLFAERGIEGVSLREINLAAKQRNTSAAHYHFGSKDALVDAIFEYRRAAVGKRRDEILNAVEAGERPLDAHSLAEALILPLAEEVHGADEEESRYLEFLAHLFLTSPAMVGDILRKYQAADVRWVAMAARALPGLPQRVLWTRLLLMGRHVVTSLAVYRRRGLGMDEISFEAYLADMLDSVAAYLAAVPSERTLAAWRAYAAQDQPERAAPVAAAKGE